MFFILQIVASLLALAVAEPVEDTPSVKAAKVAHHLAQAYDTAVHMQAKANAEMYKAHLPFVYTHQTPYVYNPAHCLKITQNVAFEFLNFGIFHQFFFFYN